MSKQLLPADSILFEETELPIDDSLDIAIIGMSGRFPGANNLDEYWQNLRDGVESITFFEDKELIESEIDGALLADPNYVKAAPILNNPGLFDAGFFGYAPREAMAIDPQHRLFLECAWEALEVAGYNAQTFAGPIAVYGGAAMNTYLLFTGLLPNFVTEYLPTLIGNDNSFLATRVAYKLNLTGPSVTVQTACSTSLVAIHMACQSLLNAEADIALAGGVSVRVPHVAGHIYQEGSVFSPDGHCRPFDAKAQGTIFGSGAGVVALKRLDDAISDGDTIHAVIKGTAINNDGSSKADYTAPSVNSQSAVIIEALSNADVEADSISYIEAHGTGTYLGDPIEVTALTKAFREYTDKSGYCALGSVKSNIGHIDAAAGIAGLIKTVLALKHRAIPPTLHFEEANPEIDFANSPFFVNHTLSEWPSDGAPRRAGISSLGIGGTNAHIILEEAPTPKQSSKTRAWQLLTLSARTEAALDTATRNLLAYLQNNPQANIADVAYTLQTGRKIFDFRRTIVCKDLTDAITALELMDTTRVATKAQAQTLRRVAFMFSGQGAQYINMGRGLYESEPLFKETIDHCAEILYPLTQVDLRTLLYPLESVDEAQAQLDQTQYTQPALFAIEYALAQLWRSWGVQPDAFVGHSIGEYVAACLADVFSLEDALALVATRGRLMQSLPAGDMLAVPLSEEKIQSYLEGDVALAAVNSTDMSVVSGPTEAIKALLARLADNDIECRPLHTSHAFHSSMMDPILAEFTAAASRVSLNAPKTPVVSNVTGTWLTSAEATDPAYWAKHLRQTVRFADCLATLLEQPNFVLLEVGPGNTLSTLARRHPAYQEDHATVASLRHPQEEEPDLAYLLRALGSLWMNDVEIDWHGFYSNEWRRRIPLPTYPFERQNFWYKAGNQRYGATVGASAITKNPNIADWFYLPLWKRSVPLWLDSGKAQVGSESTYLLFIDRYGIGAQLAKELTQQGHIVICVNPGRLFTKTNESDYKLNPESRDDYGLLIKDLVEGERLPSKIVHLWSISDDQTIADAYPTFVATQQDGFYSLLYLTQALAEHHIYNDIQLMIGTNGLYDVNGSEQLHPQKATLLGPCKVIPQEYPNLRCCCIDLDIGLSLQNQTANELSVQHLLAECTNGICETTVAYRGRHRWIQSFEPMRLEEQAEDTNKLCQQGVYLITGGLGGIGLILAEHLAKTVQARLVLTGRTAYPAKADWNHWLESHDVDDPISKKVRKLQELEALGAEVLVVQADVSREGDMRLLVAKIQKQFGGLNGVFHVAGLVDSNSFQPISATDTALSERHFLPKVAGLYALNDALQGLKLDFCILFSSVSSILGGIGYASYAAANAFMDLYTIAHNHTAPQLWQSVNWDIWQLEAIRDAAEAHISASLASLNILPAEGMEALERVLMFSAADQIVVSTGDLQARIDQWSNVALETSKNGTDHHSNSIEVMERPKLATEFVAPRNEIEQAVADIWMELLGIERVGIYDKFTELGGHSLLATQVISRLRTKFQVEFSVREMFERSTVAALGEYVETRQEGNRAEIAKVQQLLKRLDSLSPEETEALKTRLQKS